MSTSTIENKEIRKLALLVYDDENGISEHAHEAFYELLIKTCNDDIIKRIDSCEGRFFLGEDDARDLAQDL